MADVAHATIIKIESGANKNPTIETLSKIARTLDVAVDDLIK
ncbi:MAG TPA: helix-turn-helix transcriptional regulator [Candidatus Paceibacterota bacterium]|nr:helix-turn-helix transcriptional regulator [Candidatus Paceibacterota bacterium]